MIEIIKTENEDAVRGFCECSNLLYADDFEAYTALDRNEMIGYCIFQLRDLLTVVDARAKEEYGAELCDGLVRAVLNHAYNNGVNTAVFSNRFNIETWKKLQAFGHNVKTVKDIDNFLTNCKKCAH